MYITIRELFYSSHVADYLYTRVDWYSSCTRNCRTKKNARGLHIFVLKGPLEFVDIRILSFLPKNDGRSQIILNTTYQYAKLANAIPSGKTTDKEATN